MIYSGIQTNDIKYTRSLSRFHFNTSLFIFRRTVSTECFIINQSNFLAAFSICIQTEACTCQRLIIGGFHLGIVNLI